MVRIEGVIKDSVAAKQGIRRDDLVVEVDGKKTEDLIDLHFLTSKPRCRVRVRSQEGRVFTFTYREKAGPLGIIPEPIKVRKCRNKCVFCFIHQLPPGMRKSLYVKDEDYRLSFLSGNFVTLSDITDDELKKIIAYRLSPIYVSIHTTDNGLRRKMLGNDQAKDIKEILKKLTRGGIAIHGQIVLCPGINDGKSLEKTLYEISPLYPGLQTVALVPVGITAHRRGLPPIKSITPMYAGKVVDYVESFARKFRKVNGEDFLFASDEFYLKSRKRLPSHKRYGEYQQMENGVGIVRKFMNSARTFSRIKAKPLRGLSGIAITGILPSKIISSFISLFNEKTGANVRVFPVQNRLFGKTVTVSGLLSGDDIVRAIAGKRGETLFIPKVMLRETGDRFLDDLTPEGLGEITGKRVVIFEPDPVDYYRKCLEIVYN